VWYVSASLALLLLGKWVLPFLGPHTTETETAPTLHGLANSAPIGPRSMSARGYVVTIDLGHLLRKWAANTKHWHIQPCIPLGKGQCPVRIFGQGTPGEGSDGCICCHRYIAYILPAMAGRAIVYKRGKHFVTVLNMIAGMVCNTYGSVGKAQVSGGLLLWKAPFNRLIWQNPVTQTLSSSGATVTPPLSDFLLMAAATI